MKRTYFVALSVAAFLAAPAGLVAGRPVDAPRIRVVVDPRIELMTIVFRLAGNVEYSYSGVASYAKDVDAHFERFKNHPAVVRARELHKARHISFGDPIVLALTITDPPALAERVPLDPFPDPRTRWTPADARAFLADLRVFARDANVSAFFAAHDSLYRTSVARLETMLGEAGLSGWLDRFFRRGADVGYVVAISLLNGSGSFGGLRVRPALADRTGPGAPESSRREDLYVVLGTGDVDSGGLPAFPRSRAMTVVHEFAHSFVSPVVKAHLPQLMPAAETLYQVVRNEMERQAYGPGETILHETLVRACTVRYAAGQGGGEAGRKQGAFERERGFLAVEKLADLLGEYEQEPAKYPTIDTFAPRIVSFFEDYRRVAAAEAGAIQAERRAKFEAGNAPKVVAMMPENGAENVEVAGVTGITVTFDRPMRHLAVVQLPGVAFPKVTGRPVYDSTATVLTIPCRLEPGTAYGLQLNSEKNMVMTDEQGNLLAPVTWRFTTRK